MALKVGTSTGIKTIDTNLHKPVIFINGQKRIIDKAWVFDNGVKKMIWGEEGIQIDYISSSGSLATGSVFSIGENWALASYNKNVNTLNISNLSNVTMTQSINWGDVSEANEYQTTNGNQVFFGNNLTSGVGNVNKLGINPSTGAITVMSSISLTDGTAKDIIGNTNSYVVRYNPRSKYISSPRPGIINSHLWGTTYYWNDSARYTTGQENTDGSRDLYFASGGLQIDDNAVLINMGGSYGTGSGLYRAEYNTYTKIRSTGLYDMRMLDSNKICLTDFVNTSTGGVIWVNPDPNTFIVVDKTSYAELFRYSVADENLNEIKFLGKLDGYYYLIQIINRFSSSGEVKLLMIDENTYQTAWEQVLPNDPFNENSGVPVFWRDGDSVPQISQTGFLAFSAFYSGSSDLRLVRFSGLL